MYIVVQIVAGLQLYRAYTKVHNVTGNKYKFAQMVQKQLQMSSLIKADFNTIADGYIPHSQGE